MEFENQNVDSIIVGEFIAKCRIDIGLTQKELGEKIGVTDAAISKWEHGRGIPDIGYLKDLSILFNISIDELLSGGKEIKKKNDAVYLFLVFFDVILVGLLFLMFIVLGSFYYPFRFLILFFGLSLFVSVIHYEAVFIKYFWIFWKNFYHALLALSIFTSSIISYNYELFSGINFYWGNNYNLIPFKDISKIFNIYFSGAQEFSFVNYFVLNKVYIIIPYPIIMFFINKEVKFNKGFIFILTFSIIKEIIQKITGFGVFDVDDIILNVLGYLIGYFISLILKRILFRNGKKV